MKERLKAIKEEYGLNSKILKEVLDSIADLMTGVKAYAKQLTALPKAENRSLPEFIKSHSLEYKPERYIGSDGSDHEDK